MTSNINPNNIDGSYPVAGQDNNSQGFRDNFTNTGTNFQYAADEITDLQNKAVLKAALTGTTLDNNMNGVLLYNAQVQQITNTVLPLGTLSGSVTLDYALASVFTLTTNGAINLGFSNLPAAGVEASWTINITVASTTHTVTFPTAVSVNAIGIQGLNTSTNLMEFAAVGTYAFTFSTVNGGSTVGIIEVNKEIQPFNNSTESMSDMANVNLAVTTSTFASNGWTGVLNDGAEGQIKILAIDRTANDIMTITVNSAGWVPTGSGNIVFTNLGETATMLYINSAWYCVGVGVGVGNTIPNFTS